MSVEYRPAMERFHVVTLGFGQKLIVQSATIRPVAFSHGHRAHFLPIEVFVAEDLPPWKVIEGPHGRSRDRDWDVLVSHVLQRKHKRGKRRARRASTDDATVADGGVGGQHDGNHAEEPSTAPVKVCGVWSSAQWRIFACLLSPFVKC